MGVRFSAPVQNGNGAHPASCAMGIGSFPGVKWPGRGVDHLPPSNAEVKERVELYLYFPSGPSWPALGRTLKQILNMSTKTIRYIFMLENFKIQGAKCFVHKKIAACPSVTNYGPFIPVYSPVYLLL